MAPEKYDFEPEAASLAVTGSAPAVRLKFNFALIHMRAAVESARRAYTIEEPNRGSALGPWSDEIAMLVPVSVVFAAAALEANANELIQDLLDGVPGFTISGSKRRLLKDLLEDRSGDLMGRYRQIALLMEREPDTGTTAWENATLLVKFRNEFMHFKPSWDTDAIHDGQLVRNLRNRIPIVDIYKTNFVFPAGFMTYGCSKWAVHTTLAFSREITIRWRQEQVRCVRSRFQSVPEDGKLPKDGPIGASAVTQAARRSRK